MYTFVCNTYAFLLMLNVGIIFVLSPSLRDIFLVTICSVVLRLKLRESLIDSALKLRYLQRHQNVNDVGMALVNYAISLVLVNFQ